MALSPLSPLPLTASLRKDHNIVVRVIEAKNLPPDCLDLYAVVRIDNDAPVQLKTRTVWRSRTPFWDEEQDFQLGKTFNDVVVEVFSRSKFASSLVGYCKLPKLSLELDNRSHEDWYPLRSAKKGDVDDATEGEKDVERRPHDFKPHAFNAPVSCDHCGKMIWGSKRHGSKCAFCGLNCHKEECEAAANKLSCGSVGVVRIRYKYTDEYILPLPTYAKLLEFFKSKTLDAIMAYGGVTEEREEAAKSLVRISEYTGHVVDFLSRLLSVEVAQCTDPNNIFRGNSLASKAVDYYMKFVGMSYLTSTLKPIMDEIISANRSCEVDQTRLEKGEELEANKVVLQAYMEWVLARVVDSVNKCPPQLRVVFYNLSQEVVKKWPDNEQVRFTCVSGFIFLRFFNAAILGPKLFGLCTEHPNQRVSRTLTLLSKTMQQLANLVRFDGKKEPYMTPFNNFIITNTDRMKMYIRKLSALPESELIDRPEDKGRAGGKAGRDGRRNTMVDKAMPWKKQKGPAVAKKALEEIGAPSHEKIDIEIELATIHRAFLRAETAMRARNDVEKNPEVDKLFIVLQEMGYVYAARAKEIEVERESAVSLLMEEEVSLNDFLGSGPPSKTATKAEKEAEVSVLSGFISGVTPREIHASSVLNSITVNFGGVLGSVTVDEAFDMLDPQKTGSITRSDLDLILGSFGLSASSSAVAKAFSQSGVSTAAQSIPRSDYLAVLSSLVPVIAAPKAGAAGGSGTGKSPARPLARTAKTAAPAAAASGKPGGSRGSSGSNSPVPGSPQVVHGPSASVARDINVSSSSPLSATALSPGGASAASAAADPVFAVTTPVELAAAVDTVVEFLAKEGLVADEKAPVPAKLVTRLASMGRGRLESELQATLGKMLAPSGDRVALGAFVAKALPSNGPA